MFVYIYLAVALLCAAAHGEEDLSRRYRFQRTLDDDGGLYVLHWSFDLEAGTIAFAVNVSTTGWVGFGLSPNGQMPQSDVVIGWVDSSQDEALFHDRFAERRAEPSIDDSQDWILTASSERDGRTVLEFSRALVTCDDQRDIAITTDTARVVWSYGANDPEGIIGLAQHIRAGSVSINLLGGLNEDTQEPEGAQFFEIRNDEVEIPSNKDTTYWCQVYRLPEEIREQEVYVYRQSPTLTPHERAYAHHMLILFCPTALLQNTSYAGDCDDGVPNDIRFCRNAEVFNAWAVGGEDFIYPDGVAYPIGGPNSDDEYLLLEIHYDNPDMNPDVFDSSGFRFYYTTTPPTHRAGSLIIGHIVSPLMLIPPGPTTGYTITGICEPSCTTDRFPEDGITIFANTFHTHLLGSAVTLRHYTNSDSECNGYKELQPIDQNLRYDFNYQQANIVPQRVVRPGDALELECFYNSSRPGITYGGEGTQQEMCLAFATYYPRVNVSRCGTFPMASSFQPFINRYLPDQSQEVLTNLASRNIEGILEDFNSVTWTPAALNDLEDAVRTGNQSSYCGVSRADSFIQEESYLAIECPYDPPSRECTSAPVPPPTVSLSRGSIITCSAHLFAGLLLLASWTSV